MYIRRTTKALAFYMFFGAGIAGAIGGIVTDLNPAITCIWGLWGAFWVLMVAHVFPSKPKKFKVGGTCTIMMGTVPMLAKIQKASWVDVGAIRPFWEYEVIIDDHLPWICGEVDLLDPDLTARYVLTS